MNNNTTQVSIAKALKWTVTYFFIMMLATFLDIIIWRKITPQLAPYFNVAILAFLSAGFLHFVKKSEQINLTLQIGIKGIVIAILGALLFFLLLDNFLDPIFENMFSSSESEYQEMLNSLRAYPIATFVRVGLLAPIVEETLMKGFILTGLKNQYSTIIALIVSTLLFAFLHFNMVQTISAIISGLILGCIYIKTMNLTTCIMTHALYNTISFIFILI